MAGVIPFGQLILVGHHSEGRDRRYRGRMQSKYAKAFELQAQAKDYAARAAAAEDNKSISSDDPEAVTRLREKLAGLEKQQDIMKAANRIVKRKNGEQSEKLVELEALGIENPVRLFTPDFVGRVGFPDYAITNNGAEIRRCKKRIGEMLEQSKREDKEYKIDEIRIRENTAENRLQLFFPDKPCLRVRNLLKNYGFRWSPYNKAWQRQLNSGALYALESIKQGLKEIENA